MKCLDVLFLLIIMPLLLSGYANHTFVVIIPSYNNAVWYKRTIDMLCAQDRHYSTWRAMYIDDCSTDGTADLVAAYVHELGFDHKITVVRNAERKGALANLYHAIHSCSDDEIIVTCDGDDWFAHDAVLAYLNERYQDTNVWMTYGQYVEYPLGRRGICRPFPEDIVVQKGYRQYAWVSSHLRTFYAYLFKQIRIQDLMIDNAFFSMTWDLAIMFPMLEMASGHVRCIDDVLYVYNTDNPINDFKKDLTLMYQLNAYIRSQPSYETLQGEWLCMRVV